MEKELEEFAELVKQMIRTRLISGSLSDEFREIERKVYGLSYKYGRQNAG